MSKWMSRKLFVAVGGVLGAVLATLGLPEDLAGKITEVVVDIAMTYIAGQSAVDTVVALRKPA